MPKHDTKEVSEADIVEAFGTIYAGVKTMSNVDDSSINFGEHGAIKQKMSDFVQVTLSHLVQLKRQLNKLEKINRLPVEIFEYIILLAKNPLTNRHPYISYTWVCSHWRSILLHNPAFWALIRHTSKGPMRPFDYELVKRSKCTKLDVKLSTQSPPYVETLFNDGSDRIRRLSLYPDERLIQLVLSVKRFPLLQAFALNASSQQHIPRLLSILAASDRLETLEFTLWNNAPMHDLASIFGRARNLKLTFQTSPHITLSILDLLHQNRNLQSLQLRACNTGTLGNRSSHTVLPELQFLSIDNLSLTGMFQTPKLSSLDGMFFSSASNHLVLEDFDYSSVRYLYLRCPQSQRSHYYSGYCILGSKERVQCESVFSLTTDILFETPYDWPRGCFHFKLPPEELITMLQGSSIIPRLTNLVELYLLIPHSLTKFEDIIAQVPSVEKVVIQRGNKLLDFIRLLNNASLCPRLKHLSFTTFVLPKSLAKYAKDVGKALTQCLQLRRDTSVNQLEHITLRNCPPLPDIWLGKLQKLGVEVVTEKSIEDVIVKKRKVDKDGKFSDVEI